MPAAYEALTVALETQLDRAAAAKPEAASAGRPPAEPHRICQRDPANCLAWKSIPRRFCRPTIPATASTTSSAACRFRRRWSKDTFRRRPKSAAWRWVMRRAPSRKMYHVREDYSQEDHVDGLPFGTRGGMHRASLLPGRRRVHHLVGAGPKHRGHACTAATAKNEQLELTHRRRADEAVRDRQRRSADRQCSRDKNEVRIPVKAGQHALGLAFLANTYVPICS